MKDLIFPKKNSNTIGIGDLHNSFKGIIIGCKGNKPVGMVYYNDYAFFWTNSINVDNDQELDTTISNSLYELLDEEICDSFKIIEFED